MKYFLIAICIFIPSIYCSPRVKTENGELIGTTYTLYNGREVYAFLEVPFAEPPIGRYRFEKPRPVRRWFGYKNATKSSKFCVQIFHASKRVELKGEEDCLYLNIFTPRLPKNSDKSTKLMNVLFYIAGGGFSAAFGSRMTPDYILQNEDIVFVGGNYRVGPLGFFSTGDAVISGNNGLKDQIEALRWVKKNIHNFGGDPTKVTIYGSSSGAVSVHYLLLSSMSKGLFHNAVSSGSSALSGWALPKQEHIDNSMEFASSINCPTFNTRLMMKCLKRKPLKKLYEVTFKFYKTELILRIPFGPVIEAKGKDAFLTDHPYNLLKNGYVIDVPWMVGAAEQDASPFVIGMLSDPFKLRELNNKWYEWAPVALAYNYINCTRRRQYISSSVRKYYFGNKSISNLTTRELFQVFGDRLFYNGIIKATKLHRSAISAPIFCYRFYYRGTGSHCDHHSSPIKRNYGACHCDDQLYLVKLNIGTVYNDNVKSKIDLDMANLLTSSLISFMKNGNPSTADVKWQPIPENGSMDCLNIYSYTHQRMVNIENADAGKFWTEILQSEY